MEAENLHGLLSATRKALGVFPSEKRCWTDQNQKGITVPQNN